MGVLNLTSVMDGLGDLIEAAAVVPNVYRWPPESVTVPCAIIGFPTTIDIGITFQRGGDRPVFPVWIVVGQTSTKDARDALSALLGAAPSVAAALDGAHAWGDVDTVSADVTSITIGGIEYLGLKLTVDVLP